MKVLVVFAICFVAVFAEEQTHSQKMDELVEKYRKECITDMKLDPRLINKEDNATIPSPQEAICFQACLDKKLGLMNEDGSYNLERMKDLAVTPKEREEVVKIFNEKLQKCRAEVGNNPCKMAACAHSMPQELWSKTD